MRLIRQAAALAIASAAVSGWLAASALAGGSNISLQLSPGSIAANGVSQTTATITVTDPGAGPTDNVTLSSSDSGETVGTPVYDSGTGTWSATITSSTTPGPVTLTASDATLTGVSTQATLVQYGPAASVAVQFSPTSTITADGSSTTNAIATVQDAEGDPVPGDAVAISSNDAGEGIGSVTDNHDGTYSATVTSSTTAGTPTITATDSSVSPNVVGHATLTQMPGAATNVAVMLSPASIVADGASTSTVTATVTDAHGNRVPGESVTFSSSPTGNQFGAVTDHGDGTYTSTITSSTTAGTPTITATDTTAGISNHATLTQTPGPATSVAVMLSPASIVANGTSTSTATATITDAHGNPVPGDTVTVSSNDPGDKFGAVKDNGDGTYTSTITSSTTAGSPTITATDTTASVSGHATLTQRVGPASSVSVGLSPSSIVAGGTSHTTATATVTDAEGHRVAGDHVSFASSDAGEHIGSLTDHGDGTYTATITSSTRAGAPTITATDTTANVAGHVTLTQTAGPANSVTVRLSPTTIPADGTSTSTATATVADVHGNPVVGDHIIFSSSPSAGNQFSTVTDNGGGSYTSTLTSTTAGTVTIKATDGSVSGQATLTKIAASQTVLAVTTPSTVSNQAVTLLAVVSAASGNVAGAVTFENAGAPIAGCTNEAVSASNLSVSCSATFGAGSGSPQLSAVFSPGAGSTVAGSTGTASLTVQPDGTSTALQVSSAAIKIGAGVTYTASVGAAHPGSLTPSGSVEFLDNGQPIGQCASDPVVSSGGMAIASCTMSYGAIGSHSISAAYVGDGNFSGSSSASTTVQVQALGTVTGTMHWTFLSGASSTKVLALAVKGAPVGSSVVIVCRGRGCPFATSSTLVKRTAALNLAPRFQKRRLQPGARITVEIVQEGWIGRVFTFVVRAHKAPRTGSDCLVSGASATSPCPI